ncbi:hypothetical protein PEL8287_01106 [Roseovarius litorisediminis]|uniref:DUF3828 domain-containing protein n=2 Tax=Roseovarius litorisediminis TaxID=1312363 RepID=A0A1Y5RSW2_9RHOB|nr:hypothetical protein PEL8287_01106 [Roseovarius litorisediminis]
MRIMAAYLGALLLATPATAQELMGEYFTSLRTEDMRNSSGQPLNDFCAIVQQDRANYHKFGLRHDTDQGDPFFTTPEMRARITGSCRIMPGSEYVVERVLSGKPNYIWVRVFGINGLPTELLISEGAG